MGRLSRKLKRSVLVIETTQEVLDALQSVMEWPSPTDERGVRMMMEGLQQVVAPLGLTVYSRVHGGELGFWFQKGSRHVDFKVKEMRNG